MIHLLGESTANHADLSPQPPQPPTHSPQSALGGPRRTRANKACTNCARIKCKCIPRAGLGADGYSCERCHRLGKTCEPSVTVSTPSTRRATARAAAATSRIKTSNSRSARLEAKLNDLVDLLRTSQSISAPGNSGNGVVTAAAADVAATISAPSDAPAPAAPNVDVNNHSNDDDDADADGDDDNDINDINDDTSPQSAATTGITSTAPPILPDGVDGDKAEELLPHEGEACLRRFCEDMLPLAPFVYIAPDETARRMHQQYPFLWRCIKAAACIHPAHRIRAAAQARRAIIRHVVEEGERSMDVLLGMLTFVTWVHLSTKDRFHRNFATMVSQLAVCVAWDLGLTMPPLLEPSTAGERFVPVVQIPGIPASMWKAQRSMEEQRAVLGVYLVTSVTSQMFRSADGLRWSPYLDHCLQHVAQHSSVPQDATLVRHIKMQLLINQVRYSSCSNHASNSMYRSFGSGPANIPGPYMDSLRVQLDEIAGVGVDGTSPAFDNFTTHNLYHFAMLAIHESALARSPKFQQTAASGGATTSGGGADPSWMLPDLSRFKIYQRCLASVKAWLDRLFEWPLQFYVYLPSGTYLQMFYVIVCLHKLTTLQDPAWNVDAVRAVMDLFPTIDRILDMCEELRAILAAQTAQGATDASFGGGPGVAGGAADASVIEQDEHDPILVAIRKFSTLKVIWQNEMLVHEREQELAAAALANHATTAATATATATATYTDNGTILMNGQQPLDAPPPIDFFSNYSLDVLSYFQAMPDLMTDLPWP